MKPVVSILAPGVMGSALASRLVVNGLEVRTCIAGRSESTAKRAVAAGMTPVDESAAVEAELILSVVPPKEAVALAERLAPVIRRSGRNPIYVDCNAVNPQTAAEIGGIVDAAGASFVDGSIIGMPPRENYAGPALFVSGPRAAEVAALSDYGLQVRVLDAPVGAASALKMAYGGITKGLIAIGSAMIIGAERAGVARDLYEELSRSQSGLLAGFSKSIPDMFSKAGRWVAEMEEIREFVGADSPQGTVYGGFADFYSHLSEKEAEAEISMLAAFFRNEPPKS